ncbi:SDR family NAD(P)-dependent oxidoreductase [Companilactobacillus allii]|uniref:Oxidoreductase n=1 Tax=Companilactobacillus allii TaxID=1847728 RepID=A0A1P8Q3F0_9LACO|nr:SDR family NAD(P)-dependent oxidoreductase [Companilactobacillus allii]APX72349.1 oxidoreductase [Companilactobacillus allii]USQ69441.1 SDR family NAD(P)-dependent oxidoreductase [Companilactobacillus allii]
MKLNNNTILVTGGTSGIGLSFALRLMNMNNNVIIVGRSQKKIDKLLNEHPKLSGIAADISDPLDVQILTDKIKKDFPDLNIVLNSAGIMRQYDLFDENLPITELTAEIQTNLNGTIYITKSLLPILRKQNESMIVNISSLLSLLPVSDSPIYSATKAGIHMYTVALREQVRFSGANIHIVELLPPLVTETNLTTQYDNAVLTKIISSPLSKLVDAGIKGMEKNKPQIDVGFTKLLRQLMKVTPNLITHTWGKQTLTAFLNK